jgi:putative glycerol-1-phosphate prenyltransferase
MTHNNFPHNKSIALLLDPDKAGGDTLRHLLKLAEKTDTDYIFAGGSLTFKDINLLIDSVREMCSVPIVLFPGNLLQLSQKADTILLLSLISGRNAELLIGNHVIAAPFLKDVKDKVISVGYMLISCGMKTSVEYISQTNAIPSDKPDIAAATAIAGEMIGMSMIYLEAGSGATNPVPADLVRTVRENISIPLAVGGGIKNKKEVYELFNAGADLIILGNGCEKNPDLLVEACSVRDQMRSA